MQQRKFTLIELLVVIAIITILAAMLLPALHSARERGITIKCIGKMKTLGQAGQLYCGDAAGYLPALRIGNDVYWYQSSCNAPYYNYYLGTATPDRKYVPVNSLCPKVETYPNVFRTTHAQFPGETFLSFYGMNAWNPIMIGEIRVHVPARTVNPSGKLLHAETNNALAGANANQGQGLLNRDEALVGSGKIAYDHHGQANVLFFDGHVQGCKPWVLYDDADNSKIWNAYQK